MLKEEDHDTFTIGPEKGKTYNSKHGYPCKAEQGIDDVRHEVGS
jgi:protease I